MIDNREQGAAEQSTSIQRVMQKSEKEKKMSDREQGGDDNTTTQPANEQKPAGSE